jgi:hypothetical protein
VGPQVVSRMVWPFDEDAAATPFSPEEATAASAGAEPIYIPRLATPLVSRKLRRCVGFA